MGIGEENQARLEGLPPMSTVSNDANAGTTSVRDEHRLDEQARENETLSFSRRRAS